MSKENITLNQCQSLPPKLMRKFLDVFLDDLPDNRNKLIARVLELSLAAGLTAFGATKASADGCAKSIKQIQQEQFAEEQQSED